MKDLTLYRRDFKDSQYHPYGSFFDGVLRQLGIKSFEKNGIDLIEEVTIKMIDNDDIEVYP